MLDSISKEVTRLYQIRNNADEAALDAYVVEAIAKFYASAYFISDVMGSIFEQECENLIECFRALVSKVKIKGVMIIRNNDNDKPL